MKTRVCLKYSVHDYNSKVKYSFLITLRKSCLLSIHSVRCACSLDSLSSFVLLSVHPVYVFPPASEIPLAIAQFQVWESMSPVSKDFMLLTLFVDITADALSSFRSIWQFSKLLHNGIRTNSTAANSEQLICSLHSSGSKFFPVNYVYSDAPHLSIWWGMNMEVY